MEGFKLNAFQPWYLILEIIKQLHPELVFDGDGTINLLQSHRLK